MPPESRVYRVVRENCFLVVVALIQADALTISEVYGRNYFYCVLLLPCFWRLKINIRVLTPRFGVKCPVILIFLP